MAPSFVSSGAIQHSISGATFPWGAHQVNDVGLLVAGCEASDAALNLNPGEGFAPVLTVTQGEKLSVFWCRATSTSMPAPSIDDPGNHIVGKIYVFRGCVASGDPWNVLATDSLVQVSSSTIPAPAVTTTVPNCLLVMGWGTDVDILFSSALIETNFQDHTNANLTGLTEIGDYRTALGSGGGYSLACGLLPAAGDSGATTATRTTSDGTPQATNVRCTFTIALAPTVNKNRDTNKFRGVFGGVQPVRCAPPTTDQPLWLPDRNLVHPATPVRV